MEKIGDNYCRICRSYFPSNANFCPKCGTSRKKMEKIAYPHIPSTMDCVYGPQYKVTHYCKFCKKEYFEAGLGSPEAKYCPYCGKIYKQDK